ncbi:MAG: tyrosine-type recombinase/integrase [Methanosarcinales archaeon]
MSKIEKFAENLKSYSPLTKKNYICQVNIFLNNYKKVNKDNVIKFIQEKNTILRKSAIKKFCEQFYPEIKINWKKIKTKKTERTEYQTISYEELLLLLKKIKKHDIIELTKKFKHLKNLKEKEVEKYGSNLFQQLKVSLMIIFDTAARIRAVLRLRKRNLKILKNEIKLEMIEKGNKKLFGKITTETFNHLNKLSSSLNDDDYIFFHKKHISTDDIDLKYYELWSILKNISRKILGIGISFHWVRRGSGHHIYDDSEQDIVATAEFMGHKSSAQTQKYLKIVSKKLDKVLRKQKRDW